MSEQSDSKATTILVLGVLGITVCALCAPVAWIMGNGYIRDCTMEGREPEQFGVIGRILGMVGTGLFAFGLVMGCLFGTLGGVLAAMGA